MAIFDVFTYGVFLKGKKPTDIREKTDKVNPTHIALDATIKEQINYKFDVSEYPLEHGGVVSDHIVEKPLEIILVARFTETEVNKFFYSNALNKAVDVLSENGPLNVESKLKSLLKLAREKTLLGLHGQLGDGDDYSDLVITQITPLKSRSGRAVDVEIRFKKMHLYGEQEVKIHDVTHVSAEKKVNLGRINPIKMG